MPDYRAIFINLDTRRQITSIEFEAINNDAAQLTMHKMETKLRQDKSVPVEGYLFQMYKKGDVYEH